MSFRDALLQKLKKEEDQSFFILETESFHQRWMMEKRKIFPSTTEIQEQEREMTYVFEKYQPFEMSEEQKEKEMRNILVWTEQKQKTFKKNLRFRHQKKKSAFIQKDFTPYQTEEDHRMQEAKSNQIMPYHPIIHFRNTLRRLEGRENRQIPAAVFGRLANKKKEISIFMSTSNEKRRLMRQWLKKEKLQKYYRNASTFLLKLGYSQHLLSIPRFLLEKIQSVFLQFHKTFDEVGKTKKWSVHSSPNYCLVSFFLLAHHFPSIELCSNMFDFPKTKDRFDKNVELIQSIFTELHWLPFPTVPVLTKE